MRPSACFVVLALSAHAPTAWALSPEDFASGLELATSPEHAIQVLTLPDALVGSLLDPEFGDVCVLDARGKQVAQAIDHPAPTSEVADVLVPFFPLEAGGDAPRAVSVAVERDARGAIVRAFTHAAVGAGERTVSYLLDLQQIDAPREGLTLVLQASQSFTAVVDVAESDDLNTFRPLARATLAQLAHQGRTLQRNAVRFPASAAPYLRLTVLHPPGDLTLDAVSALVRRDESPARSLRDLHGTAITAAPAQVFRYEIPGAIHPDAYRVLLPEGTFVADLTISAASSADGPYQRRAQAVVQRNDETMRPLDLGPERFIELRVADKGGGIHGGTPVLRLGYVPPRLVFRTDGTAPYLLAYGSAQARCSKFTVRELFDDAGALPNADTAHIVQPRALAGDAALRAPTPPFPWRTYILWAVLIAAVLVLALVAQKLIKRT